jgi:hypothetical protein
MCFFLTFGCFFSFRKPFRCFSFILMLMLTFYSAFEKPHEFLSQTELILGCKNHTLEPYASAPLCQVNFISELLCAFLNKWNKICTSPLLLPKLRVCGLCF